MNVISSSKCFSVLRTTCIQFIMRKSNFSSLAILVNISYRCTLTTLYNKHDYSHCNNSNCLYSLTPHFMNQCQSYSSLYLLWFIRQYHPFVSGTTSIWKGKKCVFLRRKRSMPLMKRGINFLPQRTE